MNRPQGIYERLLPPDLPLAAQAEKLARLVAPADLRGKAFYAIIAEELCPPRTNGFTFPFSDLHFAEFLKERGEWRGRGFAIICRPRPTHEEFLWLALHELAHCLERRPPDRYWDFEPSDVSGEVVAYLRAEACKSAGEHQIGKAPERSPWHQHEWPFIRVLLHLSRRAERCGLSLLDPVRGAAFGRTYGLSDLRRYDDALADEPTRYGRRELALLADTPCPALEELFARDVSYRLERCRVIRSEQRGMEAAA